ncbi:hypothetical protein [Geoalkalibacter subterraneus]|uniref:Uncharacterized protein n=1 Tax=Geoalkalibacter subterraneus TaxID=483547 RepID=A0A0B5FL77_9BACT|nr:hypothetical protein [Geoalkalibacter subterraneus]AJF08148.1 hypothetical protein GSUB_16735 [Geoalkalibacter subterraneus]
MPVQENLPLVDLYLLVAPGQNSVDLNFGGMLYFCGHESFFGGVLHRLDWEGASLLGILTGAGKLKKPCCVQAFCNYLPIIDRALRLQSFYKGKSLPEKEFPNKDLWKQLQKEFGTHQFFFYEFEQSYHRQHDKCLNALDQAKDQARMVLDVLSG